MPDAGAACRCIWIVTGLRSISAVSAAIGGGIVALKKSVCRRRRQVREDAPDVGQEPHVEHTVRLVEHEVLEVLSFASSRAHVIEQPARRGDDDVDAAAERVLLRPHADAAEHRRAGDRRVHGEGVEVLEDLRRQLARRREHERARRPPRLVDQPVDDRQQNAAVLPLPVCAEAMTSGPPAPAESPRPESGSADETEFLDALEE